MKHRSRLRRLKALTNVMRGQPVFAIFDVPLTGTSDCGNCNPPLSATARRSLNGPARQEGMQALVSQGAVAWLAPRHLGADPSLPALEDYRRLLNDALKRHDFYESLLAEQVILEGLGETILVRIEQGLKRQQAPFERLRGILLHKEMAHHGFGRRLLERAIADGRWDVERLQWRAELYPGLTDAMVLTLCDLFASIEEDGAAWAADLHTYFPQCLLP